MNRAATLTKPKARTLAELMHQLGDIPLERIRLEPPPGTAKVKDLIAALDGDDKCLCELIDGVLVEKVMGVTEAYLAIELARMIGNYLEEMDLGLVFGADGPFRILPKQVRLPDVSVFTWDRLPSREVPPEKVPSLVPNLVIEVVSEGNTKAEIERKLREYFEAGVQQAWVIYPATRIADIYTAVDVCQRITLNESLTGGDVLPGFELPMQKLFRRVPKTRRKKK